MLAVYRRQVRIRRIAHWQVTLMSYTGSRASRFKSTYEHTHRRIHRPSRARRFEGCTRSCRCPENRAARSTRNACTRSAGGCDRSPTTGCCKSGACGYVRIRRLPLLRGRATRRNERARLSGRYRGYNKRGGERLRKSQSRRAVRIRFWRRGKSQITLDASEDQGRSGAVSCKPANYGRFYSPWSRHSGSRREVAPLLARGRLSAWDTATASSEQAFAQSVHHDRSLGTCNGSGRARPKSSSSYREQRNSVHLKLAP